MNTVTEGGSALAARPDARPDEAPNGATRATRYRYEGTLLGLAGFAAPPIVLASFVGLGFLAAAPGRMLTGALEVGIPIAAGLTAASLLANEPSLELQLSSRGGFRPAALRRLAVLIAWAGIVSLVGVAFGRLTGFFNEWPGRADLVRDVSMPLAPLAAYATWGALLGVALRSRGAAAAALTGFWLAGLAWKDVFLSTSWLRAWFPFLVTFDREPSDMLVTRFILLAVAGAGLAILVAWLGRGEWLLGSEDR